VFINGECPRVRGYAQLRVMRRCLVVTVFQLSTYQSGSDTAYAPVHSCWVLTPSPLIAWGLSWQAPDAVPAPALRNRTSCEVSRRYCSLRCQHCLENNGRIPFRLTGKHWPAICSPEKTGCFGNVKASTWAYPTARYLIVKIRAHLGRWPRSLLQICSTERQVFSVEFEIPACTSFYRNFEDQGICRQAIDLDGFS
jgi:hypothetical protein